MNSSSSNNLSSKYKRFTPSDCKGIRKFDSIPFTDLPFEHFYTHIQTQIKFFFSKLFYLNDSIKNYLLKLVKLFVKICPFLTPIETYFYDKYIKLYKENSIFVTYQITYKLKWVF